LKPQKDSRIGLETPFAHIKQKEWKMNYPKSWRRLIWLLIATLAGAAVIWQVAGRNQSTASKEQTGQPLPYKILDDEMGTIIRIGVKADVNEQQLRATLAKAADDHQDDPARDYLTADFLSVQAYLVQEEGRSTMPAGQLRRYVPAGNARQRKKITGDRGKEDSFTITLDDAKRTLQ
jgi:hypothetical protein